MPAIITSTLFRNCVDLLRFRIGSIGLLRSSQALCGAFPHELYGRIPHAPNNEAEFRSVKKYAIDTAVLRSEWSLFVKCWMMINHEGYVAVLLDRKLRSRRPRRMTTRLRGAFKQIHFLEACFCCHLKTRSTKTAAVETSMRNKAGRIPPNQLMLIKTWLSHTQPNLLAGCQLTIYNRRSRGNTHVVDSLEPGTTGGSSICGGGSGNGSVLMLFL